MFYLPEFKIKPKGAYARLSDAVLKKGNAFFDNRSRTLSYLDMLDCDRMLYNFRRTFGQETSAEPLGGWEAPDGLLRGHSTGHFLSALALAYSATKNSVYKAKIDYMVKNLAFLQSLSGGSAHEFETKASPEEKSEEHWSHDPKTWGQGYLSAYPPDQFALLEKFTKYSNIWAPYYTLHKILAGLIDCFTRAGSSEALECAAGIALWVYDRLSPLTDEHRKKMWDLYIAGEFGGMIESLTVLYNITGDERFLRTAKMFDNDNIFIPLSKGEDGIAGRHANQHIPQIIGAIEEYCATGNPYYYNIGKNFFDIVTKHHMYSIGGVGQAESFRESDKLAAYIKDDTNCETCAAYNLLKTARMLYSFNPQNAEYMDYYERALINQILASQTPFVTNSVHNGVTYMLPIGPGAQKSYSDDYNTFTCCHGTGMENHVKYQDASFFQTGDELYVNLYLPSTLRSDVTIDIDIPFPMPNGVITVTGDTDKKIYFRIPKWTKNPFNLPTEGRYAVLYHKSGETDKIPVTFDYTVRLEYTPDEIDGKKLASVLYGPFVMVTEDSSKEYLTIPDSFMPSKDEISLKNKDRLFIPMYKMHKKAYHTYFHIAKD